MNPNIDKRPGLELPQPSSEQFIDAHDGMSPSGDNEHALSRPEAPSESPQAAPEPVATSAPASPPPLTSALPSADPAAVVPATAQQAASVPGDDADTDELDRQWIQKAKLIVEQTKANPYVESRELSRVKSDYMKIRYNKEIKIPEDN